MVILLVVFWSLKSRVSFLLFINDWLIKLVIGINEVGFVVCGCCDLEFIVLEGCFELVILLDIICMFLYCILYRVILLRCLEFNDDIDDFEKVFCELIFVVSWDWRVLFVECFDCIKLIFEIMGCLFLVWIVFCMGLYKCEVFFLLKWEVLFRLLMFRLLLLWL